MIWLIMFVCIIASVTVAVIIAKKIHTIVYEVRLIIQNKQGEFLLVFDGAEGRFRAPVQRVSFDEIPTGAVCVAMKTLLHDISYRYDAFFHVTTSKFDRVRDDVGPLYCYEHKKWLRTYFSMYYILETDILRLPETVEKTEPFPQFYSMEFIENIGDDICPLANEMNVYRRITRIKEGIYASNRKPS